MKTLRWALIQNDWYIYQKRNIWTQTQMEDSHVRETEIRVGVPRQPEAGRGQEGSSPEP